MDSKAWFCAPMLSVSLSGSST